MNSRKLSESGSTVCVCSHCWTAHDRRSDPHIGGVRLAEYRLEELARSVRSQRPQHSGLPRDAALLDPPRRVGRSALYDDVHLSQLTIDQRSAAQGLQLRPHRRFFASIRDGHDLADHLGLQAAIFGDRRRPTAVPVPVDLDDADARRLRELGLADVVDGELGSPTPRSPRSWAGPANQWSACARCCVRPMPSPPRSTIWPPRRCRRWWGRCWRGSAPNFVPRPEEMGESEPRRRRLPRPGRPRGGRPSAGRGAAPPRRRQHGGPCWAAGGRRHAVAVTPWWWRDRRRTAARATPG